MRTQRIDEMNPLVAEIGSVLNNNLDVFVLSSEQQWKKALDDFNDKQNQKNMTQKQIDDAVVKVDNLQVHIENQEKEIKCTKYNLCKYLTETQE